MKWIAAFVLLIGLACAANAGTPDDDFVAVYNWIERGDQASQAGDVKNAIEHYGKAQDGLKKMRALYPTWHPEILSFRLEYVSDRLITIARQAQTAAQPPPAPATNKAPTLPELQKQVAGLNDQVVSLQAEKAVLEKKLREALTVQPRPADEKDLARAEQQIADLKKEKELLAVTLAQHGADIPKTTNSTAEKDLEKARLEIAGLKEKLATHKKTDADREIEQLKAKVAALEANPVVYTPDEQALLKTASTSPATFHVAAGAPPPEATSKKKIRSIKDLPPGAGALMAEGQRLFVAGEFDAAAKKYQEILRQDDKNIYVLTHLANALMAQNRLEETENTLQTALTADPEDPAALLLLGNLRLKQDRVKDALDALSKSASINPTNAVTQNSLGSALIRNGYDKAAESAFRKALQLDPTFPEAHNNLALVYATKRPPSLELARWHYNKALDYGQPKNPGLEKLLVGSQTPAPDATNAPSAPAPAAK